jgi:hypothetical protein
MAQEMHVNDAETFDLHLTVCSETELKNLNFVA